MKALSILRENAENFLDNTIVPPALLSEIPEEKKLIILIDIVGFSKSTTRQQVKTIYIFQRYVLKNILSNRLSLNEKIHISEFIPTGDGCYIVAEKCEPETALDFLTTLVGGFQYIKTEEGTHLSLRASATIGECVPFIDMAKRKNYIGEGMNEAARILSYGQSELESKYKISHPDADTLTTKLFSRNSLYLDKSLSENLENYREDCSGIYELKDVTDKHGKKRDVWVLNGLS